MDVRSDLVLAFGVLTRVITKNEHINSVCCLNCTVRFCGACLMRGACCRAAELGGGKGRPRKRTGVTWGGYAACVAPQTIKIQGQKSHINHDNMLPFASRKRARDHLGPKNLTYGLFLVTCIKLPRCVCVGGWVGIDHHTWCRPIFSE